MSVIDALRADAAALLSDGRAKLIIGFRRRGAGLVPAFVTDAEQAETLDYDPHVKINLAAYLRKEDIRGQMPLAVVAPPPVLRSLVLLAAESQIANGDVTALGVDGDEYHGVLDIPGAAALLTEKYADLAPDAETLDRAAELSQMTPSERAGFWKQQFAKCTRCYACRAACPGCYCQRCIVERNTPQWISTSAADHGNYAWNVIRAFHLGGRCTLCGACEAACPQGIPLMLLNAVLSAVAQEEFGAKVGYDHEAEPVIGSWNENDKEEYIL